MAGWVAALALERLVLVNDAVAADPFERELYTSAVQPQLELVILPLADAVSKGMGMEERRAIWLVESLHDALALVEQGLPVKSVNIGGIHAATGRSEVLPFVWLSPSDREMCGRLTGLGVRLEAQMLPSAEIRDLAVLLAHGGGQTSTNLRSRNSAVQ